ncbi:Putative dihydrolipoyllysine-residue acetyltransferase component of pyruvate dehydrogenase complex [metagenome]|uniref:Dihydrolipoyllysine-residue acetyltransferase component of pyruvate dehydrogenase complex n=1 Tax=metagenome TaxID=256318 RepID=A0A2P2C0G2_9ZZZZ
MAELLKMPEVATGTTEAILADWNVEVDKPFLAGDVIVTIETEKAVIDVPAESDGAILRVMFEAGATVAVGTPIAVIGQPGETVEDLDSLLASLGVQSSGGSVSGTAIAGTDEPEASGSILTEQADGLLGSSSVASTEATRPGTDEVGTVRLFTSPLARKLARESDLDLAHVTGTGPRGRVRKVDVLGALERRPSEQDTAAELAPSTHGPSTDASEETQNFVATQGAEGSSGYTDIPNSRMRQAIARRLTESKQTAPHFYVRGSARVDRLLELRSELNEHSEVKISVNDMIVKAVARAHQLVPGLNVQWNGDSIRHFQGVDVAVAVATEHGLLTPVIRGVDQLTITALATRSRDSVTRAKEKRLRQDELEGGTICVTNLGMYGTEEFSAIINPPQASIIAVGAARSEPVVENGEIMVATVLRVTLAVDHRPVDGATAADWMRTFIGLLETPVRLLA